MLPHKKQKQERKSLKIGACKQSKKKTPMLKALQKRNALCLNKNGMAIKPLQKQKLAQNSEQDRLRFSLPHYISRFCVKNVVKFDESSPELGRSMKVYSQQINSRETLKNICHTVASRRGFSRNPMPLNIDKQTKQFSFEKLISDSAGPYYKNTRTKKFVLNFHKSLKLREAMDSDKKDDYCYLIDHLSRKSCKIQSTFEKNLAKIRQKEKQLLQQRKKYQFEKKCYEKQIITLKKRIKWSDLNRNCVTSADEDEKDCVSIPLLMRAKNPNYGKRGLLSQDVQNNLQVDEYLKQLRAKIQSQIKASRNRADENYLQYFSVT